MVATFRFGRFELCPATRQLLVDAQPAELGARAFDVLHALIERRDRLVSKAELLDLVWPGLVVEENNLGVQVHALRRLLGHEAIATVPGRGYRFALETTHAVAVPHPPTVAPKHNLPEQITAFIGRERALAEVEQLLVVTRLLTLVGAGGIGKTRLLLQVAANALDQFPDGVWFVELASLTDPGLVPQTLTRVLGLKEEPGKPVTQLLTEHLMRKRLLLLLDNCEHLLNACAKVADTLVRQCPGVQILATGREALGITGERTYRVPSLSLPDPIQPQTPQTLSRYESVQLFTDRALLVHPNFQVTNHNVPALASICCRLDGIPLAIELAAARVRSLAIEEIDAKLDQRFSLLTGGSRTALPRQQTLRSLLDWSYDLLHHREQLLLQQLSVFAGGWTLEAAEEVCAGESITKVDILDLLASLADKSLVLVEQNDGHSHYRLMQTVRQYAREKLLEGGDGEAARERHRNYFLLLAEKAKLKRTGAEWAQWLERLEEEHENLRAGLDWSLVEAGSEGALRLCVALHSFWCTHGHLSEGREWCTRVLCKTGGERTRERAKVLNGAGGLALDQGDYAAARELHEDSLAISRELGDRMGIATSLNDLGLVAMDQGDIASARALHQDSLAILREIGDRLGIATCLHNLGLVAFEQGDYVIARALYQECLAVERELGDRGGIAGTLSNLGNVDIREGRIASARVLHQESLTMRRKLGDRSGIAMSLENLAAVAAALDDPLSAARNWGAAERLREEIGSPLPPIETPRYGQRVATARAAFGDDASFDRTWQEGRVLTLEQAIGLALEHPIERE